MTPERERCLDALAGAILAIDRPHPVRVAIDGPDAAGKTTLADELADVVAAAGRPVIRASIDGFHRSRAERMVRGPESPEGYFRESFDYSALRSALIDPLGPGGDRRFRRRVFDFRTDEALVAPVETAAADAVLLFDGVFLLRHELAGLWDVSVFVAVPFGETMRRAMVRDAALFGDAAAVRRRYETRYVPGQRLYFGEAHPEAIASVIVDNGDPDRPVFRRAVKPA
jgi:uridine kinase